MNLFNHKSGRKLNATQHFIIDAYYKVSLLFRVVLYCLTAVLPYVIIVALLFYIVISI